MDDNDNLQVTKVLSLDISSKTGWAYCESKETELKLMSYGLIGPYGRVEKQFPLDYYEWSNVVASKIIEKINETDFDVLVIEQTSKGSKNHLSQKLLEWIHYIVMEHLIQSDIYPIMFMTGEWRGLVGAKMTKEEKKKNEKRTKLREQTGSKMVKDEMGKVLGRTTKKHVNTRRANEIFSLNLKIGENDKADALLLCAAWHNQKLNKIGIKC